MGVEGQYHWLLQIVIAVTLSTFILSISLPKSFLVSFVQSVSIIFQGIWFIVMGMMLWTPSFLPKGCYLNDEGHEVVRCHTDEELHRAKSLVNLEFSWYLTGTVLFSLVVYMFLRSLYPEEVEYLPLMRAAAAEEEEDVEAQKQTGFRRRNDGNGMKPMEVGR